MSKAAQGFSLRRTYSTPQTAFSQAAGANPRRTPLIGKRAIYGWKVSNSRDLTCWAWVDVNRLLLFFGKPDCESRSLALLALNHNLATQVLGHYSMCNEQAKPCT
jgi:hypothetical protein